MKEISIEEYQTAFNSLSQYQWDSLKILYDCPNSSATSNQLAQLINPGSHQIIANKCIGLTGKAIANYLDILPGYYYNGRKHTPAYFRVIGPYNGKTGWEMNENLRLAIKNILLKKIRNSTNGDANTFSLRRFTVEVSK